MRLTKTSRLLLSFQISWNSYTAISKVIDDIRLHTAMPKAAFGRRIFFFYHCNSDKMGSIYVRDGGLASTLFPLDKVFVIFRGRKVNEFTLLPAGSFVSITAKMFGGKGGYGQLLKDFGKETQLSGNKKSMRDLSGLYHA